MVKTLLSLFLVGVFSLPAFGQRRENDYYQLQTLVSAQAKTHSRDKRWRPDTNEVVLEVTGLTSLEDGRLAVAIRKGEIWILSNLEGDPKNIEYSLFGRISFILLGLIKIIGSYNQNLSIINI